MKETYRKFSKILREINQNQEKYKFSKFKVRN